MKPIIDVCCGSRMFWFDKNNTDVLFMDYRHGTFEISDRTVDIQPDLKGDFRAIPFPDSSFSMVVFDPPHLIRAGEKSRLAIKYGKLNKNTWHKDLEKGFIECLRVLKTHGVLIFKWCEEQIPTADVLKLTPLKPLFGHRRGKTIFLVFMKT